MHDSNKKTILIVEDVTLIANSQKKELEKKGYRVLTTQTGEKAIEIVNQSNEVDLILMDIHLGEGIYGTRAAEIILENHDLPVVFITSYTDQETVDKADNITSYGFVSKSSSATVLDASLKMAFRLFEAKQKEKRANQLYQKTFNNAINGLCIFKMLYDENGNYADCKYLKINAAFDTHTGLRSEDIIGRTIRDVYPQNEADKIIELYAEAIRKKGAEKEIYFESSGRWFELSIFNIDDDIFTVAVQNTSDLKETQSELTQKRNLLSSIIESIPDAVYVKDIHARKVLANKVECYYCGFSTEDEIIGTSDFDIYPYEAAQTMYEHDQQVIQHGKSLLNIEEKLTVGEGKTIWLLTSKHPLFDPQGNIKGLIGVGRNITDRKMAEEELKKQLTEKETILKEVNHRVKNNISSIETFLQLQKASNDNPEVKSALQAALARVQSMRVLYEKMLVSEEVRELSVKKYLESFIDSIMDTVTMLAEITIDKQITDFNLDTKRLFYLGIVINEILTNTFKYAFKDRESGLISVQLEKNENYITLTVQDNGSGLPEGFDVKDSRGFGVKLVTMLSEHLGGKFTMENNNGTRNVFEFDLDQ